MPIVNTLDIKDKISVNVGLFGHIDCGKTAIAEVLSEFVSTAGIDAHPQSKERGITIDMGFTSLILDKFLVTLVDLPGHADLIRTVVASIDIIDCAIVVIDAVHGAQIQTGEHLIILESLGINHIIVALNKIDLISKEQLNPMIEKVSIFFKSTSFGSDVPIFAVSAKNKNGFEKLKKGLLDLLNKIKVKRDKSNDLIIPIDHHFPIKGIGTIITGTILQGTIRVNQNLNIIPINKSGRVKSLQIFKQDVDKAEAGDRVGIAIKGLDYKAVFRGCYVVSNKENFISGNLFKSKIYINKYYKASLKFGIQTHITLGMNTIPAYIFPFKEINNKFIAFNPDENDVNFDAIISTIEPVLTKNLVFLKNKQSKNYEKFLISRLDLPATTLRIVGIGEIIEIYEHLPILHKFKIKYGIVKNSNHPQGIIVNNLAKSLTGAKKIIGKKLERPFDKVIDTFGTKGGVVVSLKEKKNKISNGDQVILKELRSFNIKQGQTSNL
ncbi:MAG: selenocysteine-specific translation elongation factor [Candidatus Lokiarchaeota archaeon]|nr:selenocysteine-specific translation elongation factor [Candidatus Lokiarchaeota archaeon]